MTAAALAIGTLAACTSPSSEDASSAASSSSGAPPADALRVEFAPVQVMPGEEQTRCIVRRLENPTAVHVNRVTTALDEGTHHLIVYTTNAAEEQLEPFACEPFANLLNPADGAPLLIGQKATDELALPPGVGLRLGERQMVRLEMHYVNASGAPMDVGATVQFQLMPESEVKDELGFAFFANGAIHIPPNTSIESDPLFLGIPDELAGANFIAMTGHEHRRGTGVEVRAATSEADPGAVVYDPPGFIWSEPPTERFDPPLVLPAGGGFHLQCAWDNPTSDTVTFGESANDNEMCVFWTYYYPNRGAYACAFTDLIAGGTSFCCPGDAICDQIFP